MNLGAEFEGNLFHFAPFLEDSLAAEYDGAIGAELHRRRGGDRGRTTNRGDGNWMDVAANLRERLQGFGAARAAAESTSSHPLSGLSFFSAVTVVAIRTPSRLFSSTRTPCSKFFQSLVATLAASGKTFDVFLARCRFHSGLDAPML
mmetsp:Transcript_23489/g.71888  ORF Transcript_23489/g.71888 Transcript_23489/m.71888 type:complete len:147 (+) Transcript_23489:391-831(+)|eukprot:scaffold299159_cov28-Tisochrysis_lutea.AAC.2